MGKNFINNNFGWIWVAIALLIGVIWYLIVGNSSPHYYKSLMLTVSVMVPYLIKRLVEINMENSSTLLSEGRNGQTHKSHNESDELFVKIFFSPALLGAAFFLLSYEIFVLYGHMSSDHFVPAHIYRALIMSTTSVAFVGMHSIVEIILQRDKNGGLKISDFGMMLLLLMVAIFLGALIVVYYNFYINNFDAASNTSHATKGIWLQGMCSICHK